MSRRIVCRNSSGAFLLVVLAGCGDPSGLPRHERDPQRSFTAQEVVLADATVGFGLRLYQQVSSRESKPNVMVSPLSASLALGMTLNGAMGTTHDAMRNTLGFGAMPEAEINQAYQGLISQLLARAPHITLELANSIWHDRAFTAKQPFIDANRTYFDAEVAGLDFASDAARRTINEWIEENTGGRIKDMLKTISPEEVMFLVNAVYFKAPWAQKFKTESTRTGPFRRADGSSVNVPLMNQEATFRLAQNQEFTAVELAYADSAFSIVLVLPPAGAALSSLEAKLTTAWWNGLTSALHPGLVRLTLPRFKFNSELPLNAPLTTMGMGIAFSGGANFRRIADEDLYITRVLQNTFIEANEAGTEAAAATIIGIGIVSAPQVTVVEFTRPFLFAIRERTSGALLFVGRVGDPSAQN